MNLREDSAEFGCTLNLCDFFAKVSSLCPLWQNNYTSQVDEFQVTWWWETFKSPHKSSPDIYPKKIGARE